VKWRRCAQRTAEQVFVTARNRIDQMGGFREFIQGQKQSLSWDDDGGNNGSQQDRDNVGNEEEEEMGDEFTMEIMLKMAGVDEKLIGWDRGLNIFIKDS
jgi:hypothetical protein